MRLDIRVNQIEEECGERSFYERALGRRSAGTGEGRRALSSDASREVLVFLEVISIQVLSKIRPRPRTVKIRKPLGERALKAGLGIQKMWAATAARVSPKRNVVKRIPIFVPRNENTPLTPYTALTYGDAIAWPFCT